MKRTHKSLATLVILSTTIILYGIIVANDVKIKAVKTLEWNRARVAKYGDELDGVSNQVGVKYAKKQSAFNPGSSYGGTVNMMNDKPRSKTNTQHENAVERVYTHNMHPHIQKIFNNDTRHNNLKFQREHDKGQNAIELHGIPIPGRATFTSVEDPALLNCTSPVWMGEALRVWNETAPSQASRALLSHYGSALSVEEKRTLNDIIQAFVQVAETNNLTYFLYLGTLLGVYRHQGLIPWDDDFDVVMLSAERPKISRVFNEQLPHPYRLYNESGRWKVYSNATAKTSNDKYATPWNFLYVDIFFIEENRNYFVGTKGDRYFVFEYEKSHVLPVVRRPFWNMWLPLPRNYVKVINDTYPGERCISSYFSHREEHHIKRLSVKCGKLAKYYPFTTRTALNLNNIMHVNETLTLNNTIIQWVIYEQV